MAEYDKEKFRIALKVWLAENKKSQTDFSLKINNDASYISARLRKGSKMALTDGFMSQIQVETNNEIKKDDFVINK